jgi:hypothetical protein
VGDEGGGDFIVAWTRLLPTQTSAIVARRYDATGVPLGGEFVVRSDPPRSLYVLDIAPGVFFLGMFQSLVPGFSVGRYDHAGTPLSPEVPVTDLQLSGRPIAATDASGNVVAAFRSPPLPGLLGRRVAAAGVPAGPEFRIDTEGLGYLDGAGGLFMNGSGGFTVVWGTFAADGVRGRRYADPASIRLTGKRLVVVDNPVPTRRRIVFNSPDRNVSTTPGVAPNPLVDGAFVQVFNASGTGESVCIPLPAAGWTTTGPPETPVYLYRDATGAHGPCHQATLRGGKSPMVKVACRAKHQPIAYTLDEPSQGSLGVNLTSGSATYCTLFGGVVTDSGATRKFVAKNASVPTTCPTPPAGCP